MHFRDPAGVLLTKTLVCLGMRGKPIDMGRARLKENIGFPPVPTSPFSFNDLPFFHVANTTMTDSGSFPFSYGETALDEILRLSSNDIDFSLCDWVDEQDVNVLFSFLPCTSHSL